MGNFTIYDVIHIKDIIYLVNSYEFEIRNKCLSLRSTQSYYTNNGHKILVIIIISWWSWSIPVLNTAGLQVLNRYQLIMQDPLSSLYIQTITFNYYYYYYPVVINRIIMTPLDCPRARASFFGRAHGKNMTCNYCNTGIWYTGT